MDTLCLLLRGISGLIAAENSSRLLLAPAILNDSAPTGELTILDGTLLHYLTCLVFWQQKE